MPPKKKPREPKETDITTFIPEDHDLYDKRMVFLAPSGGGKSFLIKDIMQKLPRIPIGRIISTSEKYDPYYSDFCPDILISTDFDINVIQKFFDRATEISELKKKNPKYKHVNNRSLLLLDDCFHLKKSWMKEPITGEIISCGRHAFITLMVAMQSPKGFQNELKGSIDFAFVGQHTSSTDRDTIFTSYAVGFETLGQFKKAMNKLEPKQFLVFKRTNTKSSKIIDNVFVYKAKEHNGFRMFSPLVWNEHQRIYNPNYIKKYKQRKARELAEKEECEARKRQKKESRTHDIEFIN